MRVVHDARPMRSAPGRDPMIALLLIAQLAAPPTPGCAGCDGAALVAHFECNRCHTGLAAGQPPQEKQCLGCHRAIIEGRFEAKPETLAKWIGNLQSLNYVPSLTRVGERLRADWIADFLQHPRDLRPALPASMPRLAISAEQARRIAAYLAPACITPAPTTAAPATGDPARGKARYEALGCATCHRFYTRDRPTSAPLTAPITPANMARGLLLAPELSHTRARFRRDALVAWLQHSPKLKPDTAMPDFGLTAQDARDIAAWILSAPLLPPSVPIAVQAPAALTRPVRWPEVRDRVFRKVCWHCHSDAELAHGDGGPGNTGGFGFGPRGLNLATYQGIASGIRDAMTGARRSVFSAGSDGKTPLIVSAMLARHTEDNGGVVPGVRGMP
ncbi:MAG: cytochrome c2, partial [Bradymonadia bacterium]